MYFYAFNKTYYTQGGRSDLSSDEIKKGCCQITCYSLFTAKNLTCPVGHSAPTKVGYLSYACYATPPLHHQTSPLIIYLSKEQQRHVHNPDKNSEDLQRECCTKPRVSCYTLLKDNKFTCPATHLKPSKVNLFNRAMNIVYSHKFTYTFSII